MTDITTAKILILATDGFEQSELEKPLKDLRARGATVHVASPEGDEIKGWDEDHWGDTTAAVSGALDADTQVIVSSTRAVQAGDRVKIHDAS